MDAVDDPIITVCAGPPKCLLVDDEAVEAQQAVCPICKRIRVKPDGTEEEFFLKPN